LAGRSFRKSPRMFLVAGKASYSWPMKSSHVDYLRRLEQAAQGCVPEDFYLWPRTPLGHDHQSKIVERVGVSDHSVHNSYSRPALIIAALQRVRNQIPEDFSILDIACGDAIVLWQVKKAFPHSHCYGLDSNKGKFGTHNMVQRDGVELFNAFIQHLFASAPPMPFDVALMLNSYRGWESADLREHERDLPQAADAWFAQNARYTIITATGPQIRQLKQCGFLVTRLGRGEDNSKMVCISKLKRSRSFWDRFMSFGKRRPVTIA
jgi:hypothetical protein